MCFPELKQRVKFNNSDWFLSFPNGSEIWIGGLDDKERTEKILGREFSTIFLNESSEIDWNSRNIALTRLSEKNDLRKRMICDCNPPRRSHWTYKFFIEKIDPITDKPHDVKCASLLMNPKDNADNIDPDYITETLENLPFVLRKRFLEGEFWSDDTDIFQPHWLRPGLTGGYIYTIQACDPAISERDTADEAAICTIGVKSDGSIEEVETIHGRYGFNSLILNMISAEARHKPRYAGVETVAFQKAIEPVIRKEKPGTVWRSLDDYGIKSDVDKVRRAISISYLLERGLVTINTPALIKQLLEFKGEDEANDLCFIAGTMVATPTGEKPIESLITGDKVLSAFGVDTIQGVMCRATNERIITRFGLTATERHKVLTLDGGWSSLCSCSEMITTLKERILWKYLNLLSLMGNDFSCWGRESITLRLSLARKLNTVGVLKDFTLRFGNFIQGRKFRKGMQFIIRMAILLIMNSVTWSVYHTGNTTRKVLSLLHIIRAQKLKDIFKKYEFLLLNGTVLKQVRLGIENTQRMFGQKLFIKQGLAQSVARLFNLFSLTPCVVASSAWQDGGEGREGQSLKFVSARNVTKISPVNIPPRRGDVAPESALVYNLKTTSGMYYANNILVSNCDAFVFCLHIYKRFFIEAKKEPEDFQGLTNDQYQKQRVARFQEAKRKAAKRKAKGQGLDPQLGSRW